MSTASLSLHPLIRQLIPADLDRVMEIELAAYPFPWTRGIFADCLRVGYDCHGLQMGSALVGYSVQTQAAGESHLLNLCIEPHWRRRGLGSVLLEHGIRLAIQRNCTSMFLEVRASNQAGIALYLERGFRRIGERPGYYRARSGRENAIIMRIDLVETIRGSVTPVPEDNPF